VKTTEDKSWKEVNELRLGESLTEEAVGGPRRKSARPKMKDGGRERDWSQCAPKGQELEAKGR